MVERQARAAHQLSTSGGAAFPQDFRTVTNYCGRRIYLAAWPARIAQSLRQLKQMRASGGVCAACAHMARNIL
jgi:hypothetical protein